jgi:polysaccharide pyruvyl transferase WcaK-like protein
MPNASPLIVITQGYTDSNKGDAAIALGTIAALRQALPGVSLLSHSNYSQDHPGFNIHSRISSQTGVPVMEGIFPSPYLDDEGAGVVHNLKAIFRLVYDTASLVVLWFLPFLSFIHPRKARALAVLKQADLVIARGGQYLHNESGRVRGIIYLTRVLLNIALPIWLKKPTVILGLSIGPVHGHLAHWLLRATLRPCYKIVVREALSAEFLREQGIWTNVIVAPDLAFLTTPSPTAAFSLPAAPRIAVTVLNWTFPGNPQPKQALAAYLNAVFDTLVYCHQQYHFVPVFVMQVSAGHHGEFDHPVIDSLIARLNAAGVPAVLVSNDLTPADLVYLYGQCEVVLASRLHSFILAACAGVPSVAIAYQGYKTWGIMQLLGLQAHVFDITHVTSQELIASIDSLVTNRDSLHQDLLEKVETFRRQVASVIAMITAEIFGSDPTPQK